jgi:hypothetical protein
VREEALMRATILSEFGTVAGHVDYGAHDLSYIQACVRSFNAGLPQPPLHDLEWTAQVYDQSGRLAGTIEVDLPHQLGCFEAAVYREGRGGATLGWSGAFQTVGIVNSVESSATLYGARSGWSSGVEQVGYIDYESDLEGTIMAGDVSYYHTARPARRIRFDRHPLLTNRLSPGASPLWSPQCSMGRPNLFSAGAALLLLFT